jgi:5-hydroxyisourate hydrolase-like protein (transthyretin family)
MATQTPVANPSIRSSRRWINTALHLLVIFSVIAGFVGLYWVDTLPQRVDEQQTIVVGQTRFAPDSDASVRVVVQDFNKGQPIAGVKVKVRLKLASGEVIAVYEGETDETGSLPVSFHVPADAAAGAVTEATLIVETLSAVGQDRVEQPITIEREYRLLLTSDKPLYQPGQVIHMRALALSTFDLTPARGATFHFLVEDAKGNKVYRKDVTASDFGIAAVDFLLADLVNQGSYKLSVSIEGAGESATRSEKTVEVRPYVLPKFGVEVSTDHSFYLPGQRVEGVVQADYFFGKPVAEGKVRIVGSVWDVERVVLVELLGQTDENGAYEFSFDLPEYFAGSGLDSAQAQFALEVTVVDQTDHAEQTSQVLPIAEQPLIIEAVAESGVLKPGVENIVYVLTSYPDGRPAPAQLQIGVDGGEPVELASGEFGLAQFTFTPSLADYHYLNIVARDETGLEASRQINFETEYGSDSVLLRADRAAYVVGETMSLVAFTPVEFGSIYLDIVKDGQTLSTRSEKVEGGRVEFAVDVSADLYGTLELHAYKVLLEGTIVRDTRVVVVDAPNEIAIDVTADQDVYLPGELATMDFQTTGEGGGVQTALGLAIVDESVFALQRQDPGFAKLYFMLEQELMEPFYQVKGFELPAAISPEEEEIRLAQDQATKATWAGALVLATGPNINSRQEKMSQVYTAQQRGFDQISLLSVVGLILIPLAL